MTTVISHAATAAPLAALLPTRRGKAWQVGPAPSGIRANAATSRLTCAGRALIVAESGGRVEVFADEYDMFPVTPDAVVDATRPDAVAVLAAQILRTVLPKLDSTAAHRARWNTNRDALVAGQAAELTELGFALVDHGAHPEPHARVDGPALTWTTRGDAIWDVTSYPAELGTFTVAYDGPLAGLCGLLQAVLPPFDGPALPDVTSGYTWHLTGRFPQLRTVGAGEVDFGSQGEPYGFVVLPSEDSPTDHADDSTRVAAQIGGLGTDLLLSAAAHLV